MSGAAVLAMPEIPPQQRPEDIPAELTIYQAIECLEHFECQQNPGEIEQFIEIARGKSSYLEIGSNFGGSLWRVGSMLAPGAQIVSLDLPEQRHKWVLPLHSLKFNCQRLADLGYKVQLVIGDSHVMLTQTMVRKYGPFEIGFIDGDHSYEGVKKDWEDYGPMCKIVGFHDISGGTDGCVKFWNELKAEGKYRMLEFDAPRHLVTTGDWLKLGIGVVFMEA